MSLNNQKVSKTLDLMTTKITKYLSTYVITIFTAISRQNLTKINQILSQHAINWHKKSYI